MGRNQLLLRSSGSLTLWTILAGEECCRRRRIVEPTGGQMRQGSSPRNKSRHCSDRGFRFQPKDKHCLHLTFSSETRANPIAVFQGLRFVFRFSSAFFQVMIGAKNLHIDAPHNNYQFVFSLVRLCYSDKK